jgi:hypothetical protein
MDVQNTDRLLFSPKGVLVGLKMPHGVIIEANFVALGVNGILKKALQISITQKNLCCDASLKKVFRYGRGNCNGLSEHLTFCRHKANL